MEDGLDKENKRINHQMRKKEMLFMQLAQSFHRNAFLHPSSRETFISDFVSRVSRGRFLFLLSQIALFHQNFPIGSCLGLPPKIKTRGRNKIKQNQMKERREERKERRKGETKEMQR